MEKRNIQISLEEAREWYNSGDSFKKELALKAYKEKELKLKTLDYRDINNSIAADKEEHAKILEKTFMYEKLMKVATYFNNIYPKEYSSAFGLQQYYIITKKRASTLYFKYKDFFIDKCVCKSEYEIVFNTKEAAKKAIDILGDELNVLFE